MTLQVFGGMFCLSGILGLWGSLRTVLVSPEQAMLHDSPQQPGRVQDPLWCLQGYCMVRQWNISGTAMFKLKVTCAALALVHLSHSHSAGAI